MAAEVSRTLEQRQERTEEETDTPVSPDTPTAHIAPPSTAPANASRLHRIALAVLLGLGVAGVDAAAKGLRPERIAPPKQTGTAHGGRPPEQADTLWGQTPWRNREAVLRVIRSYDGEGHQKLIDFLRAPENRTLADATAIEFMRVIGNFRPWNEDRCLAVLDMVKAAERSICKAEIIAHLDDTLDWYPRNKSLTPARSWERWHRRASRLRRAWGEPTLESLPAYVRNLSRYQSWSRSNERILDIMRGIGPREKALPIILQSLQEHPTSAACALAMDAFADPSNDEQVLPVLLKAAPYNYPIRNMLTECDRIQPTLWKNIASGNHRKICTQIVLDRPANYLQRTDLDHLIIPTMIRLMQSDPNCSATFRSVLLTGSAERVMPHIARGLQDARMRQTCLSLITMRGRHIFHGDRKCDGAILSVAQRRVKDARRGSHLRDAILDLPEQTALPVLWTFAVRGGREQRVARQLISFHRVQERDIDHMEAKRVNALLDALPSSALQRETIPETDYALHYDRLQALRVALRRIYIDLSQLKATNDGRVACGRAYARSVLRNTKENVYLRSASAATLAGCPGTDEDVRTFIERTPDLPGSEVSRVYASLWRHGKVLLREMWDAKRYPHAVISTLRDAPTSDDEADGALRALLQSPHGSAHRVDIERALAWRSALRFGPR